MSSFDAIQMKMTKRKMGANAIKRAMTTPTRMRVIPRALLPRLMDGYLKDSQNGKIE